VSTCTRISEERRRLGLTQAALAEACGVDQMTVSRWERGKTTISVTHLRTLCAVLGVSADDLLAAGGGVD
jgi:transcriptional regulator with XRE-family HTH domain